MSVKEIVTDAACGITQVDRFAAQPGVNVDVLSTSRGNNSSFAKRSRHIKPLNNYVDRYAAQERDSNCSGIEKVGMKSLPSEIVADLDSRKWVNFANSSIRKSPKFINIGLLSFDATGKPNIALAPSTRAKFLNGIRRENFG